MLWVVGFDMLVWLVSHLVARSFVRPKTFVPFSSVVVGETMPSRDDVLLALSSAVQARQDRLVNNESTVSVDAFIDGLLDQLTPC